MKKMKKVLALLLCTVMAVSMLGACGGEKKDKTPDSNTGTENTGTGEDTNKEADKNEAEDPAKDNTENSGSEVVSDITATLKIAGPGLFTTVGETGSTDLITGIQKPGYEVVVKRWNELYPNVKLEIETSPWDNWKAVLQTSALSGEVDVLLHGSSITAIAEPIQAYLDKDPELKDKMAMLAMRRNESQAPFSEYVPYGMTVTANPVLVVLDKDILNHYGVAIPDASWTLEDIKTIAEKTTGTDPVSGVTTYGISLIAAGSANKNYIWSSRAMNAEVFQCGDKLVDTVGDFTKDQTKAVLNYVNDLEKFTSPDYMEGLDLSKAYKPENDLAMIIIEDPYNAYNQIKAAGLEERFMFLQLPAIEGGEFDGITSSHMGDWNMAICNQSTQKDLAWEFIKFMVTDPEVQQWIVDTYCVPNNKEYIDLLADTMPADYFQSISDIVTTCPINFSASANLCYDSGNFGTFANDITTVMNEMFQGNMDADEATAFVQKNLNEYMSTLSK